MRVQDNTVLSFLCLVTLALGFHSVGCGGNETSPSEETGEGESNPSDSDQSRGESPLIPPGEADVRTEPTEVPNGAWWEDCPIDTIEERRLSVGDITLNVACRGAGPTLVFLHGFPEFHYGWHLVMEELAGEYRLVAPDQRGYNLSDKPESVTDYELPKLAEDILNLLPLVSETPVILVAHDWGGPVGWLVAHTPEAHIRGFVSTNGPHPMRFAELISNDPAQQEASSYMEVFKAPSAEAFLTVESLSAMFEGVLDESSLAIYIDAWSQPGAVTGGLNWYRANPLEPAYVETIMAPLSPSISVPVVVMWGEADEFVLSSNAQELETYAVDLEIQTFPEVDHWIAHRIPAEIASTLRQLHQKTAQLE